MNRPPQTEPPPRRDGFALVVALLLMSTLLVLTLGLGTMTRVQVISVELKMLELKAQENARLGALVALGQLQRFLGPDARVSGRAAITGDNLPTGQGQWTGVWRANEIWNGNTFEQGTGHGDLLVWLVSGNEGSEPGSPNYAPSDALPADIRRLLLDFGGEGDVAAPRIPLAEGGAYAYWVSDENTKALAAKADDYDKVRHNAANNLDTAFFVNTTGGENFNDENFFTFSGSSGSHTLKGNRFRERENLAQMMNHRPAWEMLLRDPAGFSASFDFTSIAPEGVFNRRQQQERLAAAFRSQGLGPGSIGHLFSPDLAEADQRALERLFAHDLSLNSASVATNVPRNRLRYDYGDHNLVRRKVDGDTLLIHNKQVEQRGKAGLADIFWAESRHTIDEDWTNPNKGGFANFRKHANLDYATIDSGDDGPPTSPHPEQMRLVHKTDSRMTEWGFRLGVNVSPGNGAYGKSAETYWIALPFDAWMEIWNPAAVTNFTDTLSFRLVGLPNIRVRVTATLPDNSTVSLEFTNTEPGNHFKSRLEDGGTTAVIDLNDYFSDHEVEGSVRPIYFSKPNRTGQDSGALGPGEITVARSIPPTSSGIVARQKHQQKDSHFTVADLIWRDGRFAPTLYLTDFRVEPPSGITSLDPADGEITGLRIEVVTTEANQNEGLPANFEELDNQSAFNLARRPTDQPKSRTSPEDFDPDTLVGVLMEGKRMAPFFALSQLAPRGRFASFSSAWNAYLEPGDIPEMRLGWGASLQDDIQPLLQHGYGVVPYRTDPSTEVNGVLLGSPVQELADTFLPGQSWSIRPQANALKEPDLSPSSDGNQWFVPGEGLAGGITGGAGFILQDRPNQKPVNVAMLRHLEGLVPIGSPLAEARYNRIYDSALVSTLPRGRDTLELDPEQAQADRQVFPNTYVELYADTENPFPEDNNPGETKPSVDSRITPVTGLMDGLQTAGNILLRGGFNLNTASVNTWKVMLAGSAIHDDPDTPEIDEGWHFSGRQDEETPFTTNGDMTPAGSRNLTNAHFLLSQNAQQTQVFFTEADLEDMDNATRTRAAFRMGLRQLDDAEVDDLAVELVRLIQDRGEPFTSVREFLASGLLDRAIDQTDINDDLPEGSLAHLQQADLLAGITPLLTSRSDTFVIRAYGEATRIGQGDAPAASALCEMLVQRVPTPLVEENDSDGLIALDANINPFGRRFRVLSFRWLNAR